jgi:hypothetical protein
MESVIGIKIRIISNDYQEIPTGEEPNNTAHEIVFCVEEEDPDIFAFGILFSLSLMSFVYSAPRGISEIHFDAGEDWNLEYFLNGLEYKNNNLCFSADYVSGRCMKTYITFQSGGRVTLRTHNRSRGADRWLLHLQGKKHIQPV